MKTQVVLASSSPDPALSCLISIAKQSFSVDCHLRHLRGTFENRVPAQIAERASIAAASRAGQF
jgi:hypothetical protein